jgi:hypothetical protein
MARIEKPCTICGGAFGFEASAEDPAEFTAADWAAAMNAPGEHIASHPDSLKTGMAPDPVRRNRDWAGNAMAARGEHVPPRRSRRA